MDTNNKTTDQLIRFLSLLKKKNVSPDSFENLLISGVFEDILDKDAVINRITLRVALGHSISGLPNATLSGRRIIQFESKDLWSKMHHKYLISRDGKVTDIRIGNYSSSALVPVNMEGRVRLEVVVLYPNEGNLSGKDPILKMIAKIDHKHPWRPAGIEALIAFGLNASFDEGGSLVALGSHGLAEIVPENKESGLIKFEMFPSISSGLGEVSSKSSECNWLNGTSNVYGSDRFLLVRDCL